MAVNEPPDSWVGIEDIEVRGEWRSTGVFGPLGFYLHDGPLSNGLYDELAQWVEIYSVVLQLDEGTKRTLYSFWSILDWIGIRLAQRVQAEVGDAIQVRYFSEGTSTYLTLDHLDPAPTEWALLESAVRYVRLQQREQGNPI